MESQRQKTHEHLARIQCYVRGTWARFRQLPVISQALAGVAIVGVCLLLAAVGYRVYEHNATGGIGFYYAKNLILDDTMPVESKKKAFFDFMRPIAHAENARVLSLRARIQDAQFSGRNPNWLRDVGLEYGVEWTGNEWNALLERVDTVPLPLILVQSANESSWAQSRFAKSGNNMFGQWCFVAGCGMIPAQRDTGKSHEVAIYRSVNDSVRAYLININSSRAYSKLRAIRLLARQQRREPNGSELAAGLLSYSERGQDYVNDIRAMLRANQSLIDEN